LRHVSEEAQEEPVPTSFQLPLAWVDADEVAVLFANQFLVQHLGGPQFVLSVGQALPPPLVGTPEEQAAQVERIPYVAIKTLARISLEERRLEELVTVLQSVLSGARQEAPEPPESDG